MQQNGSPEAIFDFDDERTWFQVTLPIHPAFRGKTPFTADFSKIEWNLHGIDNLLNQIIEYAEIDERGIAGGKADTIACTKADKIENTDYLSLRSTSEKDGTLAATIVSGKADGIAGDIAGDIADIIKIFDSLIVNEIFQHIGDIAGDIAGGILRGINEKTLKILEISKIPLGSKNILSGIGFVKCIEF